MNHITRKHVLAMILILSINKCSGLDQLWQLPTHHTLEQALTECAVSYDVFNLFSANDAECNENISKDIKCVASKLDFWQNDQGFSSRRLAKMFSKHRMALEILTVVDYCNASTSQKADKWACEAFRCFSRGRLGIWMNRYVKNLYKVKNEPNLQSV